MDENTTIDDLEEGKLTSFAPEYEDKNIINTFKSSIIQSFSRHKCPIQFNQSPQNPIRTLSITIPFTWKWQTFIINEVHFSKVIKFLKY